MNPELPPVLCRDVKHPSLLEQEPGFRLFGRDFAFFLLLVLFSFGPHSVFKAARHTSFGFNLREQPGWDQCWQLLDVGVDAASFL